MFVFFSFSPCCSFFIRDGYAIEKAREAEFSLCVISGGGHLGVKKRLENLQFQEIYMNLGSRDKLSTYLSWLEKIRIPEEQVLKRLVDPCQRR